MRIHRQNSRSEQHDNGPRPWLLCALLLACAAILLTNYLRRPQQKIDSLDPLSGPTPPWPVSSRTPQSTATQSASPKNHGAFKLTAEEIVAQKLSRFATSRREYALVLAQRRNKTLPADAELFFAAVQSGNWDDIEAIFKRINGGDSSASWNDKRAPEINELWQPIIDAFGVAEQVHLWPAQQLLDYGNDILDQLRPGMVYVGGTDNGRWIPEFLNDTSDGDRHIVITQNALAASDYLEYIRLQYDGQLANVTDEDSKRIFDVYAADAQKRLEHDQQFSDEPKQLRPGEDIKVVDGKVQASGQPAVMAINEKLLLLLMEKNPDLSFALQESFPLKSTYTDALPLGPLMELGAQDEQNSFTTDRAAAFVDYWHNTAQSLMSNPEVTGCESALRSYSHDAVAAANLLAAHNHHQEAEEAYRIAAQFWPKNPEYAAGLSEMLAANGREDEARQLLDDFARNYPKELTSLERVRAETKLLWTAPSKP